MFNTENWSRLAEDTYGYCAKVYTRQDFSLHFSQVKIGVGEYFVAPSFGDSVTVGANEMEVINRWITEFREIPIKVKICSTHPVDSKYGKVTKDGVIHQIEFASYDNWYDDIVTNRFKRNIKLAQKNGLIVKKEKDEQAVINFWRMHARLRLEKFNEIPQPLSYFKNIHNSYFKTGSGFILSVYAPDTTLIGGILVIIHGGIGYYKFNASVPENLHVRPNNFLMDRLIHQLDQAGINKLNLGYSGLTPGYQGLRDFKLSTGAREFDRFTLETPAYQKLDRSRIRSINHGIQSLKTSKSSLDEIDTFAQKYYKYFI